MMRVVATADGRDAPHGTCAWRGCGQHAARLVYSTRLCVRHEHRHFEDARIAELQGAIAGIELLATCVDWKTALRLRSVAMAMRRRADAAASGSLVVARGA